MPKNKGGRPTVMTKNVVAKLEHAFLLGCTDLEACFYADISKYALYDYCKKFPEFSDRKEVLKQSPIFKARESVVKGFKKDHNHALRFLERKKKEEFGIRSTLELGNKEGEAFRTEEVSDMSPEERTAYLKSLIQS